MARRSSSSESARRAGLVAVAGGLAAALIAAGARLAGKRRGKPWAGTADEQELPSGDQARAPEVVYVAEPPETAEAERSEGTEDSDAAAHPGEAQLVDERESATEAEADGTAGAQPQDVVETPAGAEPTDVLEAQPTERSGEAGPASGAAAAGASQPGDAAERQAGSQDAGDATFTCRCGAAYRVSGVDRHRVYWPADAPEDSPVLGDRCVACDTPLPSGHESSVA